MRLPSFKGARARATGGQYHWMAKPDGLIFQRGARPAGVEAITANVDSAEVEALLEQLASEDMANALPDGFMMTWEEIHELMLSRPYASSRSLLQLPPLCPIVPCLSSRHGLTDRDFSISISGWRNDAGQTISPDALIGSIVRCNGNSGLLPLPVWRLLVGVRAFADRPPEDRTSQQTRRHWGNIRRLAVEANAILDDFLVRSVVLTPEKLDIKLRKVNVGGTPLVEISLGSRELPNVGWNSSINGLAIFPTTSRFQPQLVPSM